MTKKFDDTRDRAKISDRDNSSNLKFSDVMENAGNSVLITKAEQIKATQKLVEKKILTPLVLMENSHKSNPFRNKSGKKKKRLERELAKFGDDVLAQIPAEQLAKLLESESEESDTTLLSDSLREKLKALIQAVAMDENMDEDEEDKREVAVQNTTPNAVPTSLPLSSPPRVTA